MYLNAPYPFQLGLQKNIALEPDKQTFHHFGPVFSADVLTPGHYGNHRCQNRVMTDCQTQPILILRMGVINQFQHIHHTMNRLFHPRQGIIHKTVHKTESALLGKIRTGFLNIQHKTARLDQQSLFDNFNTMGILLRWNRIRTFNHEPSSSNTALNWARNTMMNYTICLISQISAPIRCLIPPPSSQLQVITCQTVTRNILTTRMWCEQGDWRLYTRQ